MTPPMPGRDARNRKPWPPLSPGGGPRAGPPGRTPGAPHRGDPARQPGNAGHGQGQGSGHGPGRGPGGPERERRDHPPSKARALVAEAKGERPRPPQELIAEARSIVDAYHAACALASLADLPTIPDPIARPAALEAVALAAAVEEGWRRAELLGELGSRSRRWRPDVVSALVQSARALPAADQLAAVRSLAPIVPHNHLPALLDLALAAHAVEESKAVLQAWAKAGASDAAAFTATLARVEDAALRARLLAALHHQGLRAGHPVPEALAMALAATWAMGPPARLELLRAIIQATEQAPDLTLLHPAHEGLPAEPRTRFLCALAARSDRLGERTQGVTWMHEAAALLPTVPADRREGVARNVAEGLRRLGLDAKADEVLAQAAAEAPPVHASQAGEQPSPDLPAHAPAPNQTVAGQGDATENVAQPPLPEASLTSSTPPSKGAPAVPGGAPSPAIPAPSADASAGTAAPEAPATTQDAPSTNVATAPSRRPILGLYNAYDGSLKAVHVQAIARAAPLAVAFGLDVMLVGFPVDSLAALVAQVERETQVGEGRKWLTRLAQEGRILLVPREKHAQPYAWGDYEVVALEQDADPAKACDLLALVSGPRRVCLIMGLGSRGLPPQLVRAAKHHLELTGANVPLETATVMGVVAERLRALQA